MSQAKKVHPSSLLLLVLGLLLLFWQVACSTPQQDAASSILANISNGVDAALVEPNDLVFAGQIENEAGRWINDYVVVLFKNGVEIARTTSHLQDNALTASGPMDGVFVLRTTNEYKLDTTNHFYYDNGNAITMRTVTGVVGAAYIGTWFDNLKPNSVRVIKIPEKQLEYAVVVLSMPLTEIPETHLPGNLSFQSGMLVTNQGGGIGGGDIVVQATAVPNPTPAPQSNIQFVALPDNSTGLAWNLQMTGYYGNRWDVWERFVVGRVPGMDWETFKYSVLVHNPQLEADGFVFYPEKTYLLPFNQ